MNKTFILFSAVLMVAAIGAIAFSQSSTAAISENGFELSEDKCATASAINFDEEETAACLTKPTPGGTCTPGDTYCDAITKPRMITCTAAGTWGAWTACGAGQLCDLAGAGGKCS